MKTATLPSTEATIRPVQAVPYNLSGLSSLVWEGAFANLFVVLTGGVFLTGFALFLGANDFAIGILAAVPFLMQSAQLSSAFLFQSSANLKKRIGAVLAIGRLFMLLAIPLAFVRADWGLPALIGIVLFSALLTMTSAPAWLSWMADVVPGRHRGKFFSRRNAAVAGTTVVATIAGSLLLDWAKANNVEGFGFAALFMVAVLGALLAWRSMDCTPDTSDAGTIDKTRLADLLIPIRDHSFRPVLVVFAAWNVAIGLSAAFFAPHMLINLKMTFVEIGLYTCATATVAIVSSSLWGRLIDRFGSKAILNVCAFGISLVPLIWVFPQADSKWILIPEAIYSGLLWAGFNVAAFTMPLDHSPRINRTIYLAMFATVTGLAFFGASIVAGYAAESLANWHMTLAGLTLVNYHVIFVVSAVLRFGTASLIAAYHEQAEVRLPVVVQLMGYAVLKRFSIGRQLFPFTAGAESTDDINNNHRGSHTT